MKPELEIRYHTIFASSNADTVMLSEGLFVIEDGIVRRATLDDQKGFKAGRIDWEEETAENHTNSRGACNLAVKIFMNTEYNKCCYGFIDAFELVEILSNLDASESNHENEEFKEITVYKTDGNPLQAFMASVDYYGFNVSHSSWPHTMTMRLIFVGPKQTHYSAEVTFEDLAHHLSNCGGLSPDIPLGAEKLCPKHWHH